MADPKNKPEADAVDLQKQVDAEQDQGFLGEKVDPTPNENYTLDGVVAGKPTPETDDKASVDAAASLRSTGQG